jgi:hypothetical protein
MFDSFFQVTSLLFIMKEKRCDDEDRDRPFGPKRFSRIL